MSVCIAPKFPIERPVLFNGAMVRAILSGAKTQTRRVMHPAPPSIEAVRAKSGSDFSIFTDQSTPGLYRVAGPVWAVRELMGSEPRWRCPHGEAGDRLWVRETFSHIRGNGIRTWYRADGEPRDSSGEILPTRPGEARWFPSIHMPRHESRITLEVIRVGVERLLDITEEASRAEGVIPFGDLYPGIGDDQTLTTGERAADSPYRASFACLWDEIYGDRVLWKSNPWVWVTTFKRMERA